MAKTIDITEKLTFEGNPSLMIKGKKLEVNADAPTMLKVMGIMSAETPNLAEMLQAYEMMFTEKAKAEIVKLGINTKDLMIVISEAVSLVMGETASQGEQ